MSSSRSGRKTVRRRKSSPQLYRDMEYLKQPTRNTGEQDAVVRFYAMLNIIVSFKGRPTYNIDKATMDIKVKQPLEMAFYKVFQAMLNYPSNRSLKDLVQFTCHDVLYNEIEHLKIRLGISDYHQMDGAQATANTTQLNGPASKLTSYQKKARESRMRIYEDTIGRFYNMIDLYTPYKMRPKLWDEQILPAEYWNTRIKQPIREAFQDFIAVMRHYPTKISKQQQLVDYTVDVILQNCETAMSERGIRFELVNKDGVPNHLKDRKEEPAHSVWKPLPDDMKIAIGYMSKGLSLPSDSKASKEAYNTYDTMKKRASMATSAAMAPKVGQDIKSRTSVSFIRSRFQSLSGANDTPEEDYSWLLSKQHVAKPAKAPSSVSEIGASKTNRPGTAPTGLTKQKKTTSEVRYAISSNSIIRAAESERVHKGTEAVSYRPVLTKTQKKNQLISEGAGDHGGYGVYTCFRREGSGHPDIRSKKRAVCSAQLHKPRSHCHMSKTQPIVKTRPLTAGSVTVHQNDHFG